MNTQMSTGDIQVDGHHKRTTSSVLKSIVTSRGHKRVVSDGAALSRPILDENNDLKRTQHPGTGREPLPSAQAPLGELVHNQVAGAVSPRKMKESRLEATHDGGLRTLQKKNKSAISLSSLAPKHKDKAEKNRSRSKSKSDREAKPKKSKSQTNLVGLLSRSKPSKESQQDSSAQTSRDKENQLPARSAAAAPPIWAQFASRNQSQATDYSRTSTDSFERIDDEILRYTPANYSPSKQRNFHDTQQPTLGQRAEAPKARPISTYLTGNASTTSFKDAILGVRRSSGDVHRPGLPFRSSTDQPRIGRGDQSKQSSLEQQSSSRRSSAETAQMDKSSAGAGIGTTLAKRGSRVMAAVAAFNGKAKEVEKPKAMSTKEIEAAFEALLDSRNIPLNMRDKMYALDINIKADFINHDKAESQSASSKGSLSGSATEGEASKPGRLNNAAQPKSTAATPAPTTEGSENTEVSSPTKRARPRSRTFTFSKGDKSTKDGGSPSKKQKGDGNGSNAKGKGLGLTKSNSSISLVSKASVPAADVVGATKPAVPEDYVLYLQKVPKPEDIEVGRMHKLRLVLRNERVAWVDAFIAMGGMTEIVGLLNRIMEIEWREEHEDALLHEVLLCLKALCTTAIALQKLQDIQATLFPALIGMLFDEERKGPSEFTTRGIITSLLFTYLANASLENLAPRARTILSYLRDPGPKEDAQPLGFIVSMHQPRPYRVWCKELVDVTKEVFWIFLHPLNVIANLPTDPALAGKSYASMHFPKERPPVPAAPYVGGVEWDATNYMASHLDMLNAILASLPTIEERNALRHELKVSGFERSMGLSLRTCKEKFYGAVHDGLRTWVAAGHADGWDVKDVRMGPPAEEKKSTTRSSPKKRVEEQKEFEQKIALPKLILGGHSEASTEWI